MAGKFDVIGKVSQEISWNVCVQIQLHETVRDVRVHADWSRWPLARGKNHGNICGDRMTEEWSPVGIPRKGLRAHAAIESIAAGFGAVVNNPILGLRNVPCEGTMARS